MLGGFDDQYSPPAQVVAECNQMVRKGFIRKVYGILSVQLLATAIMCALAMKVTATEKVGGWAVLSLGSVLAGSAGVRITVMILSLVLLLALFWHLSLPQSIQCLIDPVILAHLALCCLILHLLPPHICPYSLVPVCVVSSTMPLSRTCNSQSHYLVFLSPCSTSVL